MDSANIWIGWLHGLFGNCNAAVGGIHLVRSKKKQVYVCRIPTIGQQCSCLVRKNNKKNNGIICTIIVCQLLIATWWVNQRKTKSLKTKIVCINVNLMWGVWCYRARDAKSSITCVVQSTQMLLWCSLYYCLAVIQVKEKTFIFTARSYKATAFPRGRGNKITWLLVQQLRIIKN